MIYGLEESTISKINSIFKLYPQIHDVIIYGSRAKGNFRNGSDIDLTIKGKKLNLAILNEISIKIDDLNLPYLFDISIYDTIDNQDLIEHINRVGKVFYNSVIPAKAGINNNII
jgi:predicted nucleotidyltransferase